MTSRDVVNRVQRIVRPDKSGHAGTLDPLATGVLIVAVGPATRLIEYVQRMPKQYVGTFLLGRTSPTEDVEGPVTLLDNPRQPSLEKVLRACQSCTGEIEQTPPDYSAVKVQGRRAYSLARAGKQVRLVARKIVVHQIEVLRYEYPQLELQVACGSGTYIRTLGRDVARGCGTDAVMSSLVRTRIGEFGIEDACPLDELDSQTLDRWLLPPQTALAGMQTLDLSEPEISRLSNGLSVDGPAVAECGEFAALDSRGNLVAILEQTAPGKLRPVKCFLSQANAAGKSS